MILQSDNGREFVNEVITALTDNSGMEHRLITEYHPEGNGVAERHVQTVKRGVIKMTEGRSADWDIYAPAVQYFINNKVSARTGSTPFSLMFARQPNGFRDFRGTTDLTAHFEGGAYRERLQKLTDAIYPVLNEKMKMGWK